MVVPESVTLRKVFKYLVMDEEVQGYKESNLDNGFELGKGSKPLNESFPYYVKDVIAQFFRRDIPEPWNFLEFKEIIKRKWMGDTRRERNEIFAPAPSRWYSFRQHT
ncbi:hypothetical protein GOBAR_DD30615 [Gossypium barbadense]|nr:hypothetical protein GOBAR_DD30615 [Gossypium barbadense]